MSTTRTDEPEDTGTWQPSGDRDHHRRAGELTAGEFLRWMWRQVTSMRTALVLLLLLALGAIPGAVIPQSGGDALKTDNRQARQPPPPHPPPPAGPRVVHHRRGARRRPAARRCPPQAWQPDLDQRYLRGRRGV